MERLVVQEASSSDIPIILQLLYDLGRPRPQEDQDVDLFRKAVSRYISDGDKRMLVAVADDVKIVGMASAILLPRLNQKGAELYMPELVVFDGYRSRGVGRMLINACAKIAEEEGCHRIRLESGNQRTGAHAFYVRMGFDQTALSFEKRT